MAIIRSKKINETPRDVRGDEMSSKLVDRLKTGGLFETPVDIYAVAEYLGLEVVEEPMDNDLSGYLEMHGDTWVIGVNIFHHPNRKRFTVAHEIAHYVLHSDSETSFRDRTFARREIKPNRMEREADNFAADVLMPKEKVNEMITKGITSLTELAQEFGVSALAMRYRVRNLGYKVNQ